MFESKVNPSYRTQGYEHMNSSPRSPAYRRGRRPSHARQTKHTPRLTQCRSTCRLSSTHTQGPEAPVEGLERQAASRPSPWLPARASALWADTGTCWPKEFPVPLKHDNRTSYRLQGAAVSGRKRGSLCMRLRKPDDMEHLQQNAPLFLPQIIT